MIIAHQTGDLRMAKIDDLDPAGRRILQTARTAAIEGRSYPGHTKGRPDRHNAALGRLEKLLTPLDTETLNALALMWVICDRWNGATGEGGCWAVASELVNAAARRVLKDRPAIEVG